MTDFFLLAISPILTLLHVDIVSLQHFAEFSVVMMLFLAGLGLEPKKLWAMRKVNVPCLFLIAETGHMVPPKSIGKAAARVTGGSELIRLSCDHFDVFLNGNTINKQSWRKSIFWSKRWLRAVLANKLLQQTLDLTPIFSDTKTGAPQVLLNSAII